MQNSQAVITNMAGSPRVHDEAYSHRQAKPITCLLRIACCLSAQWIAVKPCYKSSIDKACLVKKPRYWSHSFFHVYGPQLCLSISCMDFIILPMNLAAGMRIHNKTIFQFECREKYIYLNSNENVKEIWFSLLIRATVSIAHWTILKYYSQYKDDTTKNK